MEAKIYNSKGKEAGSIKLPEAVFGAKWNADLVHQVTTSVMSSRRDPIAHAKMRGEVRGGGKKPWKQKGTGRARHGSSRSPIWVGGGTTHGPRNDKNYDRKVNKKARAKALASILSAKLKDGEIIFVDTFAMSAPKTKEAIMFIQNLSGIKGFEMLSKKKKNAGCIATFGKNASVSKSFANLGNFEVSDVKDINPVDILNIKYLIIENPEEAVKALEARVNSK